MKTNTLAKSVAVICSALVIAAVASGVHHIVSFAAYNYEDADKYTVGDAVIEDTVKNLDIDWTSGNIIFEYHDEDTVEISEKSRKSLSEDKKMRWWLDDDTLRIRFAKKGSSFFSFGFNQDKELTVKLPESIALENVNIDATSGDVHLPSLEAQKMTIDVVSGDIKLDLSGADELKMSSVSGNVEATLDKLPRLAEKLQDRELSTLMRHVAANWQSPARGGEPLTDDKAPVELLGMRAIDAIIREELQYYKEIYRREGFDGLQKALM